MSKKTYNKQKNSLNKNHPELLEGEVWLVNVHIPKLSDPPLLSVMDDRSDIESIGWKTKRVGIVAYGKDNCIVSYLKPVFVQRSELEKSGLDMRKFPKPTTVT